jgi:hypothetical protein
VTVMMVVADQIRAAAASAAGELRDEFRRVAADVRAGMAAAAHEAIHGDGEG